MRISTPERTKSSRSQRLVVRRVVRPGRQIGDGHRRFSLTVKLRQNRSEPSERRAEVFDDKSARRHRRWRADVGVSMSGSASSSLTTIVGARKGSTVTRSSATKRRMRFGSKPRPASMTFSAPRDSAGNQIHAAPVRQGARVQKPVIGPERADVRKAIHRHCDQIAMAEHRPPSDVPWCPRCRRATRDRPACSRPAPPLPSGLLGALYPVGRPRRPRRS